VAVDDWRVAQTWRAVHAKLAFSAASSRTESMILWRRIAGGLTAGQQSQLADPWISVLRNKSMRLEPHETAEIWRLVGSLERLPIGVKTDLGQAAVDGLQQKKNEKHRSALLWAIGRIGSRQPAYGPLNATVPTETAWQWAEQLIRFHERTGCDADDASLMLSLVQLARRTGDRFRDLADADRGQVAGHLRKCDAPPHFVQLLITGGKLQAEEESAIFGESLPLGIRLVR
jgi:hypothetical protein